MLSHHHASRSQGNLFTRSFVKSHRLLLSLAISLFAIAPVTAQSVVPNNDGTGTTVDADGNTLNIDGGSLSEDGKNLFHSFEQFGLSESEIANFMSNPDIRNILGRINGGDASIINGLIQVTGGNSNLLLMNPAGIIFGESAQLNVPADFTATSATGIGFENNIWFNAVGENDYQTLVGTPNAFAFDADNPGVVINGADLSLAKGSNLTFLGGNVVNTGKIEAVEGSVTLSAVPGSSMVKIEQEGHLLSLEIEPPRDSEGNILPFSATDLPSLLTSSGTETETGLTANADGSVTVVETGKSFVPEAALAINTGEIDVSGFEGGAVTITGNKVGVLSGEIDATGDSAGGDVRVGGEYQGGEALPRATQTIVDADSAIAVDATDTGNGGEVVIWSDSLTRFTGTTTARGGENGGDGGLVEVSGKDLLVFTGTVDAGAALGQQGELLLDPKNIIIGDDDTALSSIFSPAPESELADIAGFGISVATVGDDLLVGSPANLSGGFNNAGQAFLFDRSGNALRTYDNPEPVQGGFFGFAVAAVGSDELLVGAPRNSVPGAEGAVPEAGQVFLFNKTDSEPIETYNNPDPGAAFISSGTFTGAVSLADTNFGAALAVVDSDRFLVGAPGHTVTEGETDFERAGQAFLIGRDGATLQTFDNPNPSNDGNGKGTGNSFGIAVTSVVSDRGAIGAARNDDGAGQVFVFDLDDSTPETTIDNPEAEGSRFGQSVAEVEGDSRLAVGAPRNSEGGQVYLYDLDDTDEPTATFSNPETAGGDFGDAIAGAGEDRLLVGARSNNAGVGEAFLFDTDDTEPVETFENPSSNGGAFGTSIDLVGEDGILVGASENNFRGIPNSGEAFVSLTNSFIDADSFTGALEFDTDPGATSIITPATIISILNSGTDVNLQANNDIIVQTDREIVADNASGDGGNFILQAGRSVEIGSDITSDNGNIEIVANAPTESGVVAEFRDPGIAEIEVAEGVNLDAGTGDVTLNVAATGEGTRGNISLDSLTGNDVALTTGVGTVNVAGSVNGAGDLTITGNEIDLRGGEDSVTGQNLTVRTTNSQDINLGNQQNTLGLDLTTTDLNALDIATGEDSQIVISSDSSTGTVTLFDSVADGGANPFENAVAIAGGDTLVSPDRDFTWDIDSGNLNSIFPNGLTYSNFENYQAGTGDNVLVLGDSGADSIDGGGGNNTLVGNDDNNTFNITDLDTGNINEATEFANIQNLTGGDGNDTFSFIGDTPEISGNVDGGGGNNQLDYSEFTGLDEESFVFNPDTGEATGINGTFTSIDDAIDPANILPTELETQVRSDVSNNTEADTARETERNIPTPELNNLTLARNASETNEIALLRRIDSSFTQDYNNYYDRNLEGGQQSTSAELGVNLAEVQQTLRTIEESTGAKPALIYAAFFPSGIDALQGRNSNILPQSDDRLELVTITAEGKAIRKRIEGVTRAEVERSARRLTNGIAALQPERLFLPHSQQLYKWLIEPLKEDLKTQEISNLVFLMDSGLRSLPVAALHDGEQYLVQEYSVGLMPSISLTDTRYQNINGVDLLAMGSETFPADTALAALPAVPVEIEIITQELWSGGSSFLDADFTIDNLKQTQTSKPFGILHLATHAEFNPGTPRNSYIQFGDRKLELDRVRELGLSNPQVELMVLSACKTAVGDPDAEFGFAGLAHQAGVKSALGSLWYISDRGTLSMMSKFYQELKSAPIKAEALRRAQVAMIEKQVRLERGKLITASQTFDLPKNIQAIDLTHPFFWSPYTIVGNPW